MNFDSILLQGNKFCAFGIEIESLLSVLYLILPLPYFECVWFQNFEHWHTHRIRVGKPATNCSRVALFRFTSRIPSWSFKTSALTARVSLSHNGTRGLWWTEICIPEKCIFRFLYTPLHDVRLRRNERTCSSNRGTFILCPALRIAYRAYGLLLLSPVRSHVSFERLWGPPSLLFNGYQGLFPWE
jgi:hypothetical protein